MTGPRKADEAAVGQERDPLAQEVDRRELVRLPVEDEDGAADAGEVRGPLDRPAGEREAEEEQPRELGLRGRQARGTAAEGVPAGNHVGSGEGGERGSGPLGPAPRQLDGLGRDAAGAEAADVPVEGPGAAERPRAQNDAEFS